MLVVVVTVQIILQPIQSMRDGRIANQVHIHIAACTISAYSTTGRHLLCMRFHLESSICAMCEADNVAKILVYESNE